MPATSQLDKLISITAISVLSCFKTIRDWFRSFGFCIGGLEKDDAQADPTTLSEKADTAGENERSSTPSRCAGVVAAACTQGKRTQHGKPQGEVRDDQPDTREGQAGRRGVAERFAVPLKPGNAGGGKGPQFKTNAIRSEGPGDWATYQLRKVFRSCRRRCTRKRRRKPAIASERRKHWEKTSHALRGRLIAEGQ